MVDDDELTLLNRAFNPCIQPNRSGRTSKTSTNYSDFVRGMYSHNIIPTPWTFEEIDRDLLTLGPTDKRPPWGINHHMDGLVREGPECASESEVATKTREIIKYVCSIVGGNSSPVVNITGGGDRFLY